MDTSKILKFLKLDNLFDSISGYMEARLNLFKLEAREEIAQATSKGIQALMVIIMLGFALLFSSLAAAIFLGNWLENLGMGFLIIAAFYVLLGTVLYFLRDKLGIKERINDYLGNKIEKDERDK